MNHAAETISSPGSKYPGRPCPEILENVASKEVLFDLPVHLNNELNWPSLKISELDLKMKIWEVNWELNKMERWDEDPRLFPNRLNPGAPVGSKDPSDYKFGLTDIEIGKYVKLSDLSHASTLLRYGSSELYPYLMKRVDVFPSCSETYHSIHYFVGAQLVVKEHTTCTDVCTLGTLLGWSWKKQDAIMRDYYLIVFCSKIPQGAGRNLTSLANPIALYFHTMTDTLYWYFFLKFQWYFKTVLIKCQYFSGHVENIQGFFHFFQNEKL